MPEKAYVIRIPGGDREITRSMTCTPIPGKLVRDKIPEIILKEGRPVVTRTIEDDDDYMAALIAKLREETDEFEKEQGPEEMADILEVINYIVDHIGLNMDELHGLRRLKRINKGGFGRRVFLVGTSTDLPVIDVPAKEVTCPKPSEE